MKEKKKNYFSYPEKPDRERFIKNEYNGGTLLASRLNQQQQNNTHTYTHSHTNSM